MEDLRFYDFEGTFLHIEPDIISVAWTIYFNKIGTFEAHFPKKKELLDLVFNHPYLIVISKDKQAIITGKTIDEEIVFYGRTTNFILSKRVIPPFKTSTLGISQDVETISRYVVSTAFSDTPQMVLGRVLGFTNENYFWRNTLNPVSSVVSECLENDSAGHRVIFSPEDKTFTFLVDKQNKRELILSHDHDNIYNANLTDDLQNYASCGYYEYIPPADENGTIPPSEWRYVEKDTDKTGIYRWETSLSGNVLSEAKTSLKTKKWEKSVDAKLKKLVFGKDYFLGDLISIKYDFGDYKICNEKLIDGVNIYIENNNSKIEAILKEV